MAERVGAGARRGCARAEPLLSAWVDDELRRGERLVVAAHLQACPRCRNDVRSLRVTRALLASAPVRRLPGGVVRAPVSGTARTAPRRRPGTVRAAAARSAAALVAAACMVAAAAFALGAEPEEEEVQVVAVPVDVFVADHLVRSVGGPVSTPALLEASP